MVHMLRFRSSRAREPHESSLAVQLDGVMMLKGGKRVGEWRVGVEVICVVDRRQICYLSSEVVSVVVTAQIRLCRRSVIKVIK